jgi:hypothetical protein
MREMGKLMVKLYLRIAGEKIDFSGAGTSGILGGKLPLL